MSESSSLLHFRVRDHPLGFITFENPELFHPDLTGYRREVAGPVLQVAVHRSPYPLLVCLGDDGSPAATLFILVARVFRPGSPVCGWLDWRGPRLKSRVEHKVTLRELQMEERQVPKRTQTVVIDNSQMGVLVSVLAVPRGASMLDEYTQGGAEIEWAYEVVAEQGGKKTFEKLVRDKTASQYQFCSNMRVQNVFGGVSGAMVYPNQQVQAICERGTPRVNVTDLRREVLQRLIAHVAAIPELASVIERSQ